MHAVQQHNATKHFELAAGVDYGPRVTRVLLCIAVLAVAACGGRSSDSDAVVFVAGNPQVIEPNPSDGVIGLFPSATNSVDTSANSADSDAAVTPDAGDANTDTTPGSTGNDTDGADNSVVDSVSGENGDTDANGADDSAVDDSSSGNDGADGAVTTPPLVESAEPVVVQADEAINQLSLSGIEFDQIFQSQQFSYTASVPFLVSSTTLMVNGSDVRELELVGGSNTILLESPNNGPVYNLSIARDPRENFSSVAYIKDPAAMLNTGSGTDVSIAGDWMAILGRNVNQGVIMQRLLGDVWTQDQVLDAAGNSISLEGDVLAVGDTMTGGREVPGFSTGVVRIFERVAAGWQQLAIVRAANGDDADRFGHSVAVSGDTLVVGAPGEDSGATGVNGDAGRNDALEAGAVYVFQRLNAGQWVQQAYIKGDATGAGDRFGYSVAIDAERLLVGAVLEEGGSRGVNGNQLDNSRHGSGAAYVFERSDGNWRQRAYLKAANADGDDRFGHDVDIKGSQVAVAAVAEDSSSLSNPDDNAARDSGAVYLFAESANGWQQVAYLKASNPGDTDSFGHSVALQSLQGNALAVGAPNEDASGSLLNGVPQDNSVPDNGAVYVFARNPVEPVSWNEILYLHAGNQDSGDAFGSAVAFDAGTLVAGAPGESSNPQSGPDPADNSLAGAGATYVFR